MLGMPGIGGIGEPIAMDCHLSIAELARKQELVFDTLSNTHHRGQILPRP